MWRIIANIFRGHSVLIMLWELYFTIRTLAATLRNVSRIIYINCSSSWLPPQHMAGPVVDLFLKRCNGTISYLYCQYGTKY
ncbi:hypothetical protein F5B20DRAFT_540795 [Whalleya microplaca]|nr:hypothetical protein F5B20DRAFT_540795 [Whalleya microplaca]